MAGRADVAARTTGTDPGAVRRRIWVVGPGFLFLGGLSVYTCRLANALAADHEVAVLLLRRLIPTRLYPGGKRTGQQLTSLAYRDDVRVAGEIDWYWGAQVRRAAALLRRERPDVLVLQWWTAATLHTYLALAVGRPAGSGPGGDRVPRDPGHRRGVGAAGRALLPPGDARHSWPGCPARWCTTSTTSRCSARRGAPPSTAWPSRSRRTGPTTTYPAATRRKPAAPGRPTRAYSSSA